MKKCFVAATVALAMASGGALAQDYPARMVTLVHGFAPGGSADTVARIVAEPLSQRLGESVVVEPKPGSGGNLASAAVASAEADGHMIGLVTGGHAVSKGLYKTLPFDVVDDFTMLSTIVEYSFVLAVRDDNPPRTLGDLLAQAQAAPGEVGYGSAGVGTTHHLTGELLSSMAGIELMHVPYRGEGAAITALLGGDIPLIIASPVTLQSHIEAGDVRALAVTSAERWAGLPDVPTVAESGVAGFDVSTWSGLLAPKDLPPAIQERLVSEIHAVLAMPEVKGRIEAAMGGEVTPSTPAEMRDRIASEAERWSEVIEASGIERQ